MVITMIYFTADLHFGHANVIRYCNRPYATADEMNEALIRNWNRIVHRDDDVYILGDVTMKPAANAHEYISALKGRKYLIRGNHDRFLKNYEPYLADFIRVKDYEVLNYGDRHFVLFHYPIAEWYGAFRGAIHLYGHVHNSEAANERMRSSLAGFAYNVGVDCNGYSPVSIKDIIELADIWESEHGDRRRDRHERDGVDIAKDSIRHISLQTNAGEDFYLLLGDFLDEFYRSLPEVRGKMLTEPPEDMKKREYVPFLASTAHKLANDYGLPPPSWVFEQRCYLPDAEPHIGCNAKGNLRLYFIENSPAEFKHRNLFVDENVLVRV
jgi:calcineurin-like phosphoesterase family protein